MKLCSIVFFAMAVMKLEAQSCWLGTDQLCARCALTVTQKNCQYCNYGYPTPDSTGLNTYCVRPAANITNCLSYATATTCNDCQWGYYLAGGICTAYTAASNCASGTSATFCTSCNAGIKLTASNTCDSTSICTLANCQYCASSTCNGCNSGYTVYSPTGLCMASSASSYLSNCYSTVNGLTCDDCNAGYYNYFGRCVAYGTNWEGVLKVFGALMAFAMLA